MKKKIVALLMCFMMCLSIITGCSLITRNNAKYYAQVVAKIEYSDGKVIEITKKDLLSGYNSFGYNFTQNNQMSLEDSMTRTLDSLVAKHLTIEAVKEELGKNYLDDNEKTYLWDQTYDSILNNLKTYYKEIDKTSDKEDDENSDNTTGSTSNTFEKQARLVYDSEKGTYSIYKTSTDETIKESYEARYKTIKNKKGKEYSQVVDYNFKDAKGNYIFKDILFEKVQDLVNTSTNWKKSYTKYIKALKESERDLGLSTVNTEMFYREMDRIYKVVYENYMVQKYETLYNKSLGKDATFSNISINSILDAYSLKVRQAYTKYEVLQSSDYDSSMKDSIASMYYYKNSGTKYFYVSSIFMEFNTDTKAAYDALQENKGKWSEQKYQDELDSLKSMMVANEHDKEGNKTGETISATTLLSDITTRLPKSLDTSDMSEDELNEYYYSLGIDRAGHFKEYIDLYNEDETVKTATNNYVVGLDQNGKSVFGSNLSQEYADAAIKLYNNGNAVMGDVLNELVFTEKGAYILFYAGEIENLFTGIDENFDLTSNPNAISVLDSRRINIFNKKTWFDSIYETLATDDYSIFENMNIDTLKQDVKITYIKSAYKDLYKKK
ncbi:MAG: hypothetical protein IJ008_01070 [Clostridia bacterium]|nr:hypothetical protein [Clostridia bacterium]